MSRCIHSSFDELTCKSCRHNSGARRSLLSRPPGTVSQLPCRICGGLFSPNRSNQIRCTACAETRLHMLVQGRIKRIRNVRIVALHNYGFSYTRIGRRYGLSRQRVGQIIHAYEKEPTTNQ